MAHLYKMRHYYVYDWVKPWSNPVIHIVMAHFHAITPSVLVYWAPNEKLYNLGRQRLDVLALSISSKLKLNWELNLFISANRFSFPTCIGFCLCHL